VIPLFDSPRRRTFPYVNVAIIAVNFIVFFYELSLTTDLVTRHVSQLDIFILHWGNIPACTLDSLGRDAVASRSAVCSSQPHPASTILTAMFIHGGWLHIAGNMLFLFIFGDNVEDAMGHIRYAIFYLLIGAVAAFTHMSVYPDDLQPAIGASGAIAGVMGAYIVLFPRATVTASIPLLFFIPFPIPAFVMIGFWFIVQLFSGFSAIGVDAVGAAGGVAYFAHIGGFIAGAALVNVFLLGRPRPAPVRPLR